MKTTLFGLPRLGLIMYLGLCVSGCATAPLESESVDAKAKQFLADPENATVYIYRESSFYGAAIGFPITVDGNNIGSTTSGSYFLLKLSPGVHDIWVSGGDSVRVANVNARLSHDFSAGKIYFIHQDFSSARNASLILADEDSAKNIIRSDCKRLKVAEQSGDVYKIEKRGVSAEELGYELGKSISEF